MQVDERPTAKTGARDKGRGLLIGIAAAAVILIGGLIVINTGEDDVATPAPNATQLTGDFHPIAPGAYFVDTDVIASTTLRGTFVIETNEWDGFQNGFVDIGDEIEASLLVLEVDRVWEAPCDGGAPSAAATSAKGLADQFAAMPGVNTVEGLTPVSAFGRDGYHLVLEVPESCNVVEPSIWSGAAFLFDIRTYGKGDLVEYWFLDVEGTPVMVEATQWYSRLSEEEMAELRAVLDTLVITP